MIPIAVLIVSASLAVSVPSPLPYPVPVELAGAWTLKVGPGALLLNGVEVAIAEPVLMEILPPERIAVQNEEHAAAPVYNEKAGGWVRGAKLKRLVTKECTATGVLYPETVRVKPQPDGAAPFELDKDYRLEPFWGTFGRIEGGALKEQQPVYVDYDYSPNRLDSIVVDAQGNLQRIQGESGMGAMLPPVLPSGTTLIANVFVTGQCSQLAEENLFPVDFSLRKEAPGDDAIAEKLLPKTLAKLRAGLPVSIVAWGDSVTNGGGVDGHEDQWYQQQFFARLQKRFPTAEISLRTAAWPGGNSRGYMNAPAGGTHDYQRDVLAPKPDLVTIEFVNDAYLDEAGVKEHYGKILADLRGIGAEVILITPHLVRPDWLKSDTLKVDDDPRPYVKGLRAFAEANQVALADASREWCRLWRKGIPYTTLLANSINHPDERGHRIFADALMALFPEK